MLHGACSGLGDDVISLVGVVEVVNVVGFLLRNFLSSWGSLDVITA